jgi:hypothetical protein
VGKRNVTDPVLQTFEAADVVSTIARHRSARILVITDPQDRVVLIQNQLPFVEKFRKAGGQVELFFVEATDDLHHFTTPHAALAIRDCIRGASHEEIEADLAALVAKSLAAKATAATNAIVRTQDMPAERAGGSATKSD